MTISMECLNCGGDKFTRETRSTADSREWVGEDGLAYFGPSEIETKQICAQCGWAHTVLRQRGVIVWIMNGYLP